MRYDVGVEEFLSLVKCSAFVIANSFHGLIFADQYRRPVIVFTREQADSKISEFLSLMHIENASTLFWDNISPAIIDYDEIHRYLAEVRTRSLAFLKMELDLF